MHQTLRNAVGIQIYSDGGLARGRGAAAYVVTVVYATEQGFRNELVGARGVHLEQATTPFGAEVAALDLATKFASTILARSLRS